MKAVLFDFNGTLFDDTRFHVQAWRRFWRERFALDFSEEEVWRRFIGPGNTDILRGVLGEDLTEAQISALSFAKEEIYRGIVRADPRNRALVAGAEAFFGLLRSRGIPFVVATSSRADNVEFYLTELGLGRWLAPDGIVYDDGALALKPDPAFYLEAARRAGAAPAQCLVFEDSMTGIQAAVNAGAGRIVALDRSAEPAALKARAELYAVTHDFIGAERFLDD